MASSNKDKTMEYDKRMYGQPEKSKARLAECHNEFQEKFNERQAPLLPVKNFGDNEQAGEGNVLDDIKHLCQVIRDHGQQGDYAMEIKFGELIPIYGSARIDELVELLAIARKNGYINYSLNDFFRQDRDEDIHIRLVRRRQ